MQAYSQDLRERVLRALDRGERPTEIARRFEVSRVWVYQVRDRLHETGERGSFQIGGHHRSRLAEFEPQLLAWIASEPDLTLAELQERLAKQSVSIKIGALWHQLNRWNLTLTKNSARQRARARGRAGSAAGVAASNSRMGDRQAGCSRSKLCLDQHDSALWESSERPSLRRVGSAGSLGDDDLRGRLAARRTDRADADRRAINGDVFLAYVTHFLCPTLRPGDIVILDNLSSHKVPGVEEAIRAVGATLRPLPPYSPDLNPIEKLFVKLKALLRKAATRKSGTLWQEIGRLLDFFSPQECSNYFASSRYVND
jgi:transposase